MSQAPDDLSLSERFAMNPMLEEDNEVVCAPTLGAMRFENGNFMDPINSLLKETLLLRQALKEESYVHFSDSAHDQSLLYC